ncbi:MAG: squalene/phytoene synthase family protein, partial [Rubellimicrobium sp.]|nr:squalene/phytoene synthase family protein [Rubellimicrobium sp.]
MSLAACAALVERGDPDRFLATMAAPPAVREVLFPLYAFNLEIARAPFVTEEPMIAEMRLQWWRDVVDEAVAGAPARAHEVAGPLAALIRTKDLPGDVLDRAIEARRWDIGRAAFVDEAALRAHLQATSGGLAWIACHARGLEGRHEAAVRQAAFAGGLANWFLAVPGYEARGR